MFTSMTNCESSKVFIFWVSVLGSVQCVIREYNSWKDHLLPFSSPFSLLFFWKVEKYREVQRIKWKHSYSQHWQLNISILWLLYFLLKRKKTRNLSDENERTLNLYPFFKIFPTAKKYHYYKLVHRLLVV